MYKLLIVDDETEIRRGLRHLDWASVHVEPVAECEHGLEACQWMAEHDVDLVLTDIRMPIMDGIELAAYVARHHPFVKTLVLSGYNDFELARASMRNGIFDYLLKPIDPSEVLAVFKQAIQALHRERQQREKQHALERKVRNSTKLLGQEFLRRLLNQSMEQDELEESCATAEMLLEDKQCTVCVIQLDLQEAWEQAYPDKDRRLIMFAFDNALSELWDGAGKGYHWLDSSGGTVCLIAIRDRSMETNTEEAPMDVEAEMVLLKQHLKRFRGLIRTTLSIGIGTEYEAKLLNRSYKEALASMKGRAREAITSYDHRISSIEADESGGPGEGNQMDSTISSSKSQEVSGHYLVEAAKAYVDSHFEGTLTLQEVAQHVHINASYLSHLFKEVTGSNFVHYLTWCRINKAKQLLHDPQYKIYEISQMVGYENPRYFAEIFKKYTGSKPFEYRSS